MKWNTILTESFTFTNDVRVEALMDQMWHFECPLTPSPQPSKQMAVACRSNSNDKSHKLPLENLLPSSISNNSETSEASHFEDGKYLLSIIGRNSPKPLIIPPKHNEDTSFRTIQTRYSTYPYFATAELRAIFETFDENGDGRLTAHEIRASMAKLGLGMTEEELSFTIAAVDKNGDGFVDSEEFCSLYKLNSDDELVDSVEEDEENLKRAFEVFDKNKDGYITAQELQTVLLCLGSSQEADKLQDCRNMIRGADLDGDGRINFIEL